MNFEKQLPLVITMGEPAGIGWEITVKAWTHRSTVNQPFYLLDDFNRLKILVNELEMNIPVEKIVDPTQAINVFSRALPVFHIPLSSPVICGKPSSETAKYVIHSIEVAVQHVQSGLAAALITNPIQKMSLYDAGFKYPGHTEFLGSLASSDEEPLMMLSCRDLRVVPVTVHINLLDAISQLNQEMIVKTSQLTATALNNDFGIVKPRLAVAGLNPHAGEKGSMGQQEQSIIGPAIMKLRNGGIHVTGPHSPDTLFSSRTRKTYDAAICMYHDQALIPVKTLDFDGGVNITLGLPFVRTSPDHGTALDIAGRNLASEKSMVAAINTASEIYTNRSTTNFN